MDLALAVVWRKMRCDTDGGSHYRAQMDIGYIWRGSFDNEEVNRLHAKAFDTRVFTSEEWDWSALTAKHSLGWVVARSGDTLVGFVNVLGDGLIHAWLQDVMVSKSAQRQGVGKRLVQEARSACRAAGCEWLHVDFTNDLRPFYVEHCDFFPTAAGLMRLS